MRKALDLSGRCGDKYVPSIYGYMTPSAAMYTPRTPPNATRCYSKSHTPFRKRLFSHTKIEFHDTFGRRAKHSEVSWGVCRMWVGVFEGRYTNCREVFDDTRTSIQPDAEELNSSNF